VRDLPVNPKVKPISEPDMMIVHVIMPKAEEVPAATAEGAAAAAAPAAAAEPEVIKKGKKEEVEEKE
jgi:ribosomal protein L12E/L44/L45/RPP1/RPP2